MKNRLTIALNDLRVFFSDRGNLLGLIIIPIAMTILVGSSFGGNNQGRLRADLLDLDETPESASLIQTLRDTNPQMYLCPLDQGQPAAPDSEEVIDCGLKAEIPYTLAVGQARVTDNDTGALIVIPEGYGELFGAFQPVMVTYYSLSTVATGEDVIQASLSAALQRVNGAVIAAQVGLAAGDSFGHNGNPTIFKDEADRTAFTRTVYDTADSLLKAEPIALEVTQSTAATSAAPQPGGFRQSVPGMGSMFVMFTVLGGIGILLRERKQWTLQRLVTMPLTRGQILGGKILAYFVLGMIQYVIVFAVGFLTGTTFGSSPLALLLLMMSFCLCVTALTLALATRIGNEGQAQGLTLLISMTLAPLGGAWWPLSITPPIMQAVGHLSPVAWVMDGFNTLIFFNGGLMDILLPVGVLLGASVVLFGVGIMGFKYE